MTTNREFLNQLAKDDPAKLTEWFDAEHGQFSDSLAHESRESYSERMYDVPVSDCPYCGCERVVIHDYSDAYEHPHSYRVEHVDEKEAFNEGCFTSYFAFDSVEKAVEHADMRDANQVSLFSHLVDRAEKRNEAERLNVLNTSMALENNRLSEENAELRAKLGMRSSTDEERELYRQMLDRHSTALPVNIFDLHESANLGADLGTSEAEASTVDEVDTREKLEADVLEIVKNGFVRYEELIALLDRQAAITKAEWSHVHDMYIDDLRAERDELAAAAWEDQKRINELQARLESCEQEFLDRADVIITRRELEKRDLQAKLDELTAELAKRDKGIARLKAQRDEAREERERYRSLLSDAVDRAHGIVTLVDIDGEVVS